MQRIYVPLDLIQRKALIDFAGTQYRDPRIQAVLFIQQGLEKVGALPTNTPDPKDIRTPEVLEKAS